MKKSSNHVSPFLILLIPVLFVIGYHTANSGEIEPQKQQANVPFQMPHLRDFKAAFNTIGKVYETLTGTPCCRPGTHVGDCFTTRNASLPMP